MIIKSKPLSPFLFRVCSNLIAFGLKLFTNKLKINPVDIKPGHSYILMLNHFSFTDGLYAKKAWAWLPRMICKLPI